MYRTQLDLKTLANFFQVSIPFHPRNPEVEMTKLNSMY